MVAVGRDELGGGYGLALALLWVVVWVSGGELWHHAVDLLVGLAVHDGLLKGHWVLALLGLRRVVHRRRRPRKKKTVR